MWIWIELITICHIFHLRPPPSRNISMILLPFISAITFQFRFLWETWFWTGYVFSSVHRIFSISLMYSLESLLHWLIFFFFMVHSTFRTHFYWVITDFRVWSNKMTLLFQLLSVKSNFKFPFYIKMFYKRFQRFT